MKKKFWIAVDEDGDVYLFKGKPIRKNHQWTDLDGNYDRLSDFIYKHLDLTWESEPYEIEI